MRELIKDKPGLHSETWVVGGGDGGNSWYLIVYIVEIWKIKKKLKIKRKSQEYKHKLGKKWWAAEREEDRVWRKSSREEESIKNSWDIKEIEDPKVSFRKVIFI